MSFADASGRLLSSLWQASWQGALFAGLVGLFCLLLRLPASQRAFLWLIAGIKFLGGFLWLLFSGRGIPLEVPLPLALVPVPTASGAQGASLTGLTPWILAAWLTGILVCTAWVASRARATILTLSRSSPLSYPALVALITLLAERVGVPRRRIPALRVAPRESDGPQVTLSGGGCVILLPEGLLPPSATALRDDELRFVLAHELAHVRRGDLWVGLFFAATQILFFFHPFSTWVRKEWEAAREESCDLIALRACSDGATDTAARYGALLLRLGSGVAGSSVASARIAASPFAALRRRLSHLNCHQARRQHTHSLVSAVIALPILVTLMVPVDARFRVPAIETPSVAPEVVRRTPAVSAVARRVPSNMTAQRHASFTSGNRVAAQPPVREAVRARVTPSIAAVRKTTGATHTARVPFISTPPAESATHVSIPPSSPEPILADEPTPDTVFVTSSPSPAPVIPDASPEMVEAPLTRPVSPDVSGTSSTSSVARYAESSSTRGAIAMPERDGIAGPASLVFPGPNTRTAPTLPPPAPVPEKSSPQIPTDDPDSTQIPKR